MKPLKEDVLFPILNGTVYTVIINKRTGIHVALFKESVCSCAQQPPHACGDGAAEEADNDVDDIQVGMR